MNVNFWFRWHHGTATDPKWQVVARRASHAMSRHVTRANVLAVWACMEECASQATDRGTLEGWCDEDVGAALDIDEAEVAAIHAAMCGKTLSDDGKRLTAWEKRQPKREREDTTAAERKRAQREREAAAGGVTRRDNSASRLVTPREEEKREERALPGSVDTHSPGDAHERVSGATPDSDAAPEHGRAFDLLDEHQQQLVRPLLGRITPSAGVDLPLLASFVDHAGRKRGVVQSAGWYAQLSLQIAALSRDGHDVNESIRRTIAAGNCVQLIVPQARAGPAAPAGKGGTMRENYEEVDYR